jgi:hypothetical protein
MTASQDTQQLKSCVVLWFGVQTQAVYIVLHNLVDFKIRSAQVYL